MREDGLPMWTIYANPSDYPGKCVVRRCVAGGGIVVHDKEPCAVMDTLAEARAAIEALAGERFRLDRHPDDNPVILETWI